MSAARSVSAVAAAAVVLAGCTSTQDVNRRYALRAERVLAARKATPVATPNPAVGVGAVQRVGRRAIVVALTNRTGRPLTDLPISVGAGKRVLNLGHALDYSQTRVLAIAPHATVQWVFASAKPVPKGKPFARVGTQTAPRAPVGPALPRLTTSADGTRVRITNTSDIPQYNLPVYALSRAGNRYVAAGRTTVEELDQHASTTVTVPLAGTARGRLELEALPTILR